MKRDINVTLIKSQVNLLMLQRNGLPSLWKRNFTTSSQRVETSQFESIYNFVSYLRAGRSWDFLNLVENNIFGEFEFRRSF